MTAIVTNIHGTDDFSVATWLYDGEWVLQSSLLTLEPSIQTALLIRDVSLHLEDDGKALIVQTNEELPSEEIGVDSTYSITLDVYSGYDGSWSHIQMIELDELDIPSDMFLTSDAEMLSLNYGRSISVFRRSADDGLFQILSNFDISSVWASDIDIISVSDDMLIINVNQGGKHLYVYKSVDNAVTWKQQQVLTNSCAQIIVSLNTFVCFDQHYGSLSLYKNSTTRFELVSSADIDFDIPGEYYNGEQITVDGHIFQIQADNDQIIQTSQSIDSNVHLMTHSTVLDVDTRGSLFVREDSTVSSFELIPSAPVIHECELVSFELSLFNEFASKIKNQVVVYDLGSSDTSSPSTALWDTVQNVYYVQIQSQLGSDNQIRFFVDGGITPFIVQDISVLEASVDYTNSNVQLFETEDSQLRIEIVVPDTCGGVSSSLASTVDVTIADSHSSTLVSAEWDEELGRYVVSQPIDTSTPVVYSVDVFIDTVPLPTRSHTVNSFEFDDVSTRPSCESTPGLLLTLVSGTSLFEFEADTSSASTIVRVSTCMSGDCVLDFELDIGVVSTSTFADIDLNSLDHSSSSSNQIAIPIIRNDDDTSMICVIYLADTISGVWTYQDLPYIGIMGGMWENNSLHGVLSILDDTLAVSYYGYTAIFRFNRDLGWDYVQTLSPEGVAHPILDESKAGNSLLLTKKWLFVVIGSQMSSYYRMSDTTFSFLETVAIPSTTDTHYVPSQLIGESSDVLLVGSVLLTLNEQGAWITSQILPFTPLSMVMGDNNQLYIVGDDASVGVYSVYGVPVDGDARLFKNEDVVFEGNYSKLSGSPLLLSFFRNDIDLIDLHSISTVFSSSVSLKASSCDGVSRCEPSVLTLTLGESSQVSNQLLTYHSTSTTRSAPLFSTADQCVYTSLFESHMSGDQSIVVKAGDHQIATYDFTVSESAVDEANMYYHIIGDYEQLSVSLTLIDFCGDNMKHEDVQFHFQWSSGESTTVGNWDDDSSAYIATLDTTNVYDILLVTAIVNGYDTAQAGIELAPSPAPVAYALELTSDEDTVTAALTESDTDVHTADVQFHFQWSSGESTTVGNWDEDSSAYIATLDTTNVYDILLVTAIVNGYDTAQAGIELKSSPIVDDGSGISTLDIILIIVCVLLIAGLVFVIMHPKGLLLRNVFRKVETIPLLDGTVPTELS